MTTADRAHRLLGAPHALRRSVPVWIDRLIGSDPGLLRLQAALQTVVTIAVAMLVEAVFVKGTHALQIDTHGAVLSPQQAALVAAQHHGMLVIAIMLGALAGMMAAFTGAMFTTTRARIENFVLMPVLMVAGLALGLALALVPSRAVSLAALVVVLAAGGYLRRFGPIGFVGGMLLFLGDFFGFFLNGSVALSDLGWLAIEIGLGVGVAALGQFTVFRPRPRAALQRLRRSYEARAMVVLRAALALVDPSGADGPTAADRRRSARRLQRRLVRLNESALMIDAALNDERATPPGVTPESLHQALFDAELALTNLARFAGQLAAAELPAAQRARLIEILRALVAHDPIRAELAGHQLVDDLQRPDPSEPTPAGGSTVPIVLHRFAVSVLGFLDAIALGEALAAGRRMTAAESDHEAFRSGVVTIGGWLPGSVLLSGAASTQPSAGTAGRGWLRPWRHVAVPGHIRVMIQIGIAVGAAVALGDIVSGRRFYWAVIAAFITFMGTSNTGEQLRKGSLRIVGTVVGVVLGGVGAHLVGQHTNWAIAVILAALFFGLYLMRVSYAFMVIGVTIMVSQLYVQLDEYTNSLLVLRLGETALGAAVTALVVTFVLPLRTRVVARLAAQSFLTALGTVIDAALAGLHRPDNPAGPTRLRGAIRELDATYQAYMTTVVGLRPPLARTGSSDLERFQQAVAAARHYARNLVVDTREATALSRPVLVRLDAAHERLSASVAVLVTALSPQTPSRNLVFVRSAALFAQVATELDRRYAEPEQLTLRDLQLLDGALATLAEILGLPVHALDRAPVGRHAQSGA